MGRFAFALLALSACARPAPSTPPRSAGEAEAAVVHLSSECSGVLVGPREVLTAAHCVEAVGPWVVRLGAERRPTVACAVHPEAYIDARGCGEGAGRSRSAHDLAILRLAEPFDGVRPVRVLLTAPSLRDGWWRGRRIRVVAWDRRPRVVGPLARRSGPNGIASSPDADFRTHPIGRRGFATVVGDSGAPALLDLGREEGVVGILFGGTHPGARDSVWVSTLEPANARWLLSTLEPGFAEDLAHLDPEQPWDQADWTELGLRLTGRAP